MPDSLDLQKDRQLIERMLKELPPGIPELSSREYGNFSKYRHRPRKIYKKDEAWRNCASMLEKHDIDLCKAYREEIDTILVFAGLFSAVVTAFSVESYSWLQDNPNDAVIALLLRISQSAAGNGTDRTPPPPLPYRDSTAIPHSVAVRINTYWFVSLSLSLSAALVATLCKQWVRQFERYVGLSPRDFVGVRQMKLDGLETWKVWDLISALPLLMQLSLAGFALGIIELLWRLHTAVAIAVCIPTVGAMLFYIVTTFLPVIQHYYCRRHSRLWHWVSQCPYKSPQSFLAIQVYTLFSRARAKFRSVFREACWALPQGRNHGSTPAGSGRTQPSSMHSWNQFDREAYSRRDRRWESESCLPGSYFRGLRWLSRNIDQPDVKEWIWTCIWEEAMASDSTSTDAWRTRGILHVLPRDSIDKQGFSGAGSRALAMLSLASAENLTTNFVAESFIHNVRLIDPVSATHILGQISRENFLGDLDLDVAASLVRVVTSYARVNISWNMGALLRIMHVIVTDLDTHVPPSLHACILTVFVHWLHPRAVPGSKDFPTATSVLNVALGSLLGRREDYPQHPERLHKLLHAQSLAELTRLYMFMCGLPVLWSAVGGLEYRFPELLNASPGIRPIVDELLKLSYGPEGGHLDRRTECPAQSQSRAPPQRGADMLPLPDAPRETPLSTAIATAPPMFQHAAGTRCRDPGIRGDDVRAHTSRIIFPAPGVGVGDGPTPPDAAVTLLLESPVHIPHSQDTAGYSTTNPEAPEDRN